ncbi:MAG: hypothetical protein AAF633_27245, partial [Chloroflexota bacterium]
MSGLTAEEPPTWTPEPEATAFDMFADLNDLTPEASDRLKNRGPAESNDSGSGSREVSDLQRQLEKLESRLGDLDKLDSGTQSSMASLLSNSLTNISQSNVSPETARSIYNATKTDLSNLAAIGQISQEAQGALSNAAEAMESETS